MNQTTLDNRLGFCSWSVQPANADELIAAARQTGIPRVQLALDPIRQGGEGWRNAAKRLSDAGISVVSGMVSCVGEDYSTIESIHRTGGVLPDATWRETLANIVKMAPIASASGLHLVTLHAGFIPNDEFAYNFAKVVKRISQIAAIFEEYGIQTGLETGQERASTLRMFLEYISEFNVGVNFDPANMLLYGSGDPIEALRLLLPFIKQVHIKDATRSPAAGEWGDEVPVGTGEVNWKAFFDVLRGSNYKGNFVIEREAGANRIGDIRHAREFLATAVNAA